MTREERQKARLERLEARKSEIRSTQKLTPEERNNIRQTRTINNTNNNTNSSPSRKGCGCSRR